MVELYILISIISTGVFAAGIIATNIWNKMNKKDKVKETRQALQQDVEKTARDKFKEEQQLAQKLASENKAIASDVKQDMKSHIDRLILILKADIELQSVRQYSKMGEIDSKVMQLKIDLSNHIQQEKDDLTRMQKSIDFFQTMSFGPEAKSTPPYITGEEETQIHKDEADKGVFASRKDTTNRDTEDPK